MHVWEGWKRGWQIWKRCCSSKQEKILQALTSLPASSVNFSPSPVSAKFSSYTACLLSDAPFAFNLFHFTSPINIKVIFNSFDIYIATCINYTSTFFASSWFTLIIISIIIILLNNNNILHVINIIK